MVLINCVNSNKEVKKRVLLNWPGSIEELKHESRAARKRTVEFWRQNSRPMFGIVLAPNTVKVSTS